MEGGRKNNLGMRVNYTDFNWNNGRKLYTTEKYIKPSKTVQQYET